MKKITLIDLNHSKKALVRFFITILISCIITFGALSFTVFAAETAIIPNENGSNDSQTAVQQQNQDGELAPNESSALYDLIGIDASQPIEVILLITVLSVAPSILLMMTSYTRIIIVFSFLRNAMQTQTTPPNQVLTGLALFMTIFIMWPVIQEINTIAYQPYADGEFTVTEAIGEAGKPIKTFMLKQTNNKNMAFFLDLAEVTIYQDSPASEETAQATQTDEQIPVDFTEEGITLENYQDKLGFEVVIPAFMVSELSRAFQMGFMLFIPFLIIDIVVSSTLMSMGMMMLPPAMISLPFKIMLFILVDGWQMLLGSIYTSYNL